MLRNGPKLSRPRSLQATDRTVTNVITNEESMLNTAVSRVETSW